MTRIRVLHVIPSLSNGGAERVAVTVARHQSQHFEVHLVTWLVDSDYPPIPGIIHHRIPFRGKGIQKFIWLIIGLQHIIKNNPPDALISHLGYTNLITNLASRITRMSGNVWSVHHSTAFQESRLETYLVEKIYKKSKVVAVSQDVEVFLRKRGVENVKMISNPLRLPESSKSLPRWIEPQILRIVAVGRIVPEKNYALMIAAMQEMRVPFILEIFGSGEPDGYKNALDQLPPFGNIVFMGNVSANEIYKALASAHVFLMTSDVEGEPSSLLEAAAIGLPVVGRDTPGLGAAVVKVGGYLPAISDNPKSIADAVLEAAKAGKNKKTASAWTRIHDVELASHLYCELLTISK